MRGLLLKLSNLDPDVEASLRVIEYFDRLLSHGASLDAVLRATAALGCCTAGLRDESSGRTLRFDEGGAASPPMTHPITCEAPVLLDDAVVGHVWLERPCAQPLDEVLIERLAVTAAARWRSHTPGANADPALVELVIASAAQEEDRSRALRLLGMNPAARLTVLAVSVPGSEPTAILRDVVAAATAAGALARASVLGVSGVVLLQGGSGIEDRMRTALSSGPAPVGIGVGCTVPVAQAPDSWASARVALRFAVAWRQRGGIVEHEKLGALAALAHVPRDVALATPDVRALAVLAATDSGEQDIEVLLAVTWHGSARQAAAALHMHHSSVTNRLRHVEAALGVEVDNPSDRLRAQMAALLWRLNAA